MNDMAGAYRRTLDDCMRRKTSMQAWQKSAAKLMAAEPPRALTERHEAWTAQVKLLLADIAGAK